MAFHEAHIGHQRKKRSASPNVLLDVAAGSEAMLSSFGATIALLKHLVLP